MLADLASWPASLPTRSTAVARRSTPARRYTDPKVALVWEVGQELFAGRCWGQDELLGRVIRTGPILRGAEGGPARRLFTAWETELNLETAGLFRELVLACADASGPDAVELEDPASGAKLTLVLEFDSQRGAVQLK